MLPQNRKKMSTSYKRPGKNPTPSKIVSRQSIEPSSSSGVEHALKDFTNRNEDKKTPKSALRSFFKGSSKVTDEVSENFTT